MKIQGIQRVMSPRLFQKDRNIHPLKRNLKIHSGNDRGCSHISFFQIVFFFSMFRNFFFTGSDSFCQDTNDKLCSLKQQPNKYFYSGDKFLYTKSFLEHRESVQLLTSRRLRLICTLRHVPYILLGEGTMIVSNI